MDGYIQKVDAHYAGWQLATGGRDGVMDQGCTWLEPSLEGLDQSTC